MDAFETDDELLRLASRERDRRAMDCLIRRYANLVHGVAWRQTRNSELAADVSQAVFVVLVRRVSSIRDARALPYWLLQTTRLAVKGALRSKHRRRIHEARAAKPEQTMSEPSFDLADEASHLDEAIASLRKDDRDIVLMKFFQGHDTPAIATILGVNEDAARKRISRAVERIRILLVKRGAVLSAAGVTTLLATAGGHSAPAAVVQASIAAAAGTSITTGVGVAIANKVAAALLWSKLKLATCAIVVAIGSVGAVSVLQQSRAADTAQPATPQPVQRIRALETDYALADGQVLRLIEPPFPASRQAWADKEFPGVRNIGGIGFVYGPRGLTWRHMSMSGLSFDSMAESPFQLEWYTVMGWEQVEAERIIGDLVVRENASTREKLDALAELITQRTGQLFKFTNRKISRPCLILHGKTHPGLKSKDGRNVVLLSLNPIDEQTRQMLMNEERPRGYHASSSMDGASERVSAPFFCDPVTGIEKNVRFLVAPEARLDPADPELTAKLKRVAENLRAQVGGQWSIENRELEVWVLERLQL